MSEDKDTAQERNEDPTQLRREKARKKGQVAASADLTNAVLLVGGLLTLKYVGPTMATRLMGLIRSSVWAMDRKELSAIEVPAIYQSFVVGMGSICLPIVAVAAVLGIATSLGQVGPNISSESLQIDWSKLSPAKGFSRLFSLKSVMRSIMMTLKIAVSAIVVYWATTSVWWDIQTIGDRGLPAIVSSAWHISLSIAIGLAGSYFVIGAADYAYQRFQHEKDLRMSKQEIRDEQKEQEGDANVKARIRKLQRESAKQIMLKEVPTASVVLTNPTHYAVALRYDRNSRAAPIVVAKGTDAFARRIAAIARENGVSVLERKPLARALYAMVEVNQEIPPELYKAIAEILAFVFGLRRR